MALRESGLNYTFDCNALAYDSRSIYLGSVVGPGTAIKGMKAALKSGIEMYCTWEPPEGLYGCKRYTLESGYHCYVSKLRYSQYHMVFIDQTSRFMPCCDEEALWQHLQYFGTTPVKREWLTYIGAKMQREREIVALGCYNCKAALVNVNTEIIDRIVTSAVMSRNLKI